MVNNYKITSSNNGDIIIVPDGTGKLLLNGVNFALNGGTSGQAIVTDGSGNLLFKNLNVNPSNVIYVAKSGSDGAGDGSANNPYASITKAVTVASTYTTIDIAPGTYTENFTVTTANLFLRGNGATSSNAVIITGTVTVGANNFTAQNIDFWISAASPTLVCQSNFGLHRFQNCTFRNLLGSSNPIINCVGTNFNNIWFLDCYVVGIVLIDTQSTEAVRFFNLTSTFAGFQINSGVLTIQNCTEIGPILHNGGSVEIANVQLIAKNGINSTFPIGTIPATTSVVSSSNNASDVIALSSVNLQQQDFTFGKFTKTGTCGYVFNDIIREPSQDTVTGTRLEFGALASDFVSNYTATNYTQVDASVAGALGGIDNKLGLLKNASGITYNPTTPSNWPVVPSNVLSALDDLAGNSTTLSSNKLSKGSATIFCIDNGDFATLQDAINSAAIGDTVVVGPIAGGWGNITLSPGVQLVGLGTPQDGAVQVGTITWNPTSGSVGYPNTINISNIYCLGGISIGGTVSYRLKLWNCYVYVAPGNATPTLSVTNNTSGSSLYAYNCYFTSHGTGPNIVWNGAYGPFTDCSISGGTYAVSINSSNAALVFENADIEYNYSGPVINVSAGALYMSYSYLNNGTSGGSGIAVSSGASATTDRGTNFNIAGTAGYCVSGTGTYTYGNVEFSGVNSNIQSSLTINHRILLPTTAP